MSEPRPAPENDLVLRAMRGQRTERTPVWLMRQAGRFDPAYRTLRADAGLELEQLFAHPERAAEITVLPIRFGVDAAILFQDILTILGPMGANFVFRPGPVLERPVGTPQHADHLREFDPADELSFVFESVRLALDRLEGRVPLLGFAGAPLTLLHFLVYGGSPGSDAGRLVSFLNEHTDAAEELLRRLASVTESYLREKIRAGVHAVQLFESSADAVDQLTYERWALPYQQAIFDRLSGTGVPTVLFARNRAPGVMARSGASVLSIGSGRSIVEASRVAGGRAVQGNVDNQLLLNGSSESVRESTMRCIRDGGHRGHVLNLGHGVLKDTPVANVRAMIDTARECSFDDEVAA